MIRFYAQLYNVTSGEVIDSRQKEYSFGEYLGYIDLESASDVMMFKDGTIIDTVPRSALIYNIIDNVGPTVIEVSHNVFDTTGVWPILRFLKTASIDDNYLEWNPSNPSGFTIKVDGVSSNWDTCLQWSENSVYPCIVFIKASNTADLLSAEIHYTGGYLINSGTTLVGRSTGQFTCDLPRLTTEKVFIDQVMRGANYEPTYQPIVVKSVIPDNEFNYYYGCILISRRDSSSYWWACGCMYTPIPPTSKLLMYGQGGATPPGTTYQLTYNSTYGMYEFYWSPAAASSTYIETPFVIKDITDIVYTDQKVKDVNLTRTLVADAYKFRRELTSNNIYQYLMKSGGVVPEEPGTDVDPEDIPPEDEPPAPIPPDDQDPYYDPTSDPDNPEYDPTKDPDNPQYDPTEPHTPYRPPSQPSDPPIQQEQPPVDPIPTPETPPSYVTTNAMFTLYNPSGGDLTNLANFLWSPTWSIDTFKKIFANPLDCILGLMVMPHLSATVGTKVMNVGNISTGVTMHYFTSQFYDFDCGTFELMEYYNSYLDYAPYTKVDIFLPYIGDKQLSTDEVMNKTLGVKYRFDLATGDCVAFITVDGTVLYQFSGNCAARLPLAGNNWNGIIPAITGVAISAGSMAAGLPALGAASAAAVSTMKETISHTGGLSGSAGLMGVQTPYLIVTRPRQALPLSQNSFTGYPSFITESLGSLTGYTEVEQCHLEHVPATGAELEEIERLLKEGVLF